MDTTTVAIDLAKSVFEVAVADGTWRITERRRFSRMQLERFLSTRSVAHVVMDCVCVGRQSAVLMDRAPNFFMSTAGEYEPLAPPRACWERARLRDVVRDDHMLIDIEPALDGQRFGLGSTDITQLIISARHRGQTLYPVSEWPSFVYVARVLDNAVLESRAFTREQVDLVAWGTLFRTREEASELAKRFQK